VPKSAKGEQRTPSDCQLLPLEIGGIFNRRASSDQNFSALNSHKNGHVIYRAASSKWILGQRSARIFRRCFENWSCVI
jgi:hypothetical protein